jgi:hypothetical protein
MSSPSLHAHYRRFTATTTGSAPHASPNHGCRFPLSIWPDGMEFTCSLKWPVLRFPMLGTGSANFTPDAVWPVSSGRLPHFVIGTNVTTYFPHRNLPYRGFVTGLFTFSSISTHLQESMFPFFLTAHHTSVSAKCSVRRFDGCPGRPPSEGLSIGNPIVLHPFQSIQPQGADSSHTRYSAWRRRAIQAVCF